MKNVFNKHKPLKIALVLLVAGLLIFRFVLPVLILNNLNKYLADFSPAFYIHIGDLDLKFLQTSYRFENITGKNKKTSEEFLKVDSVDVSLAWRELFKGRIVTDIEVYDAHLVITKLLLKSDSFKKEEQGKTIDDAKGARDKLFPVKVESLAVRDSTFEFSESLDLPLGERLILSNINGSLINLTPDEKRPLSLLSADGNLLGSTNIQIAGQLKMLNDPMDWDIDIQTRQFNLVTTNPALRRMVPITFTNGTVDIYSEVKKEEGHMQGYIKVFFKNLEIIGNRNDFKNVTHFFIELGATLADFIFKNPKTKTLATQINFNDNNGKTEFHVGDAIDTALENANGQGLQQALNNSIQLKTEKDERNKK